MSRDPFTRACPCEAALDQPCAVYCSTIAAATATVKLKIATAHDARVTAHERADAIEWLFVYGWGIEACG